MVKSKFYKIAALTVTLSLAIGSSVFAAEQTKDQSSDNKTYTSKHMRHMKNAKDMSAFRSKFIKNRLDTLVKAKTITQAQEDAVIKLFATNEKDNFKNGVKTKLDTLVNAKTITQSQEDAIVKLFTANKPKNGTFNHRSNRIKLKLDNLVKAKTITQSQEDAIVKLFTTNEKGFKKDTDGIKTKLDSLVSAKTITQAQEDSIINALTHFNKK